MCREKPKSDVPDPTRKWSVHRSNRDDFDFCVGCGGSGRVNFLRACAIQRQNAPRHRGSNHAETHMTNDEKITYYLRDMRQKGVRSWTAAPPLYRLLWRLGIKVRPPLFASFRSLYWPPAVLYLCFFLLLWWWEGGSHFWWWEGGSHSISGLVATVVAAVSIGVIMAAIIRRKARKLALPRWEDYPSP